MGTCVGDDVRVGTDRNHEADTRGTVGLVSAALLSLIPMRGKCIVWRSNVRYPRLSSLPPQEIAAQDETDVSLRQAQGSARRVVGV